MQDANQALKDQLEHFGQSHLLQFWEQLDSQERKQLELQIRSVDFALLEQLFRGEDHSVDWSEVARRASPPQAFRLHESKNSISHSQAKECGEEALREGKVAMILVAGGQGTRLGFDLPKGLFRIGPVSNRTLFAMHVDSLRASSRRYQTPIPLLVMTSPATDSATRDYFQQHDFLGLCKDELIVFCQGTMPAIRASDGKVLMESKSTISLSPDGHGGIVAALDRHSILKMAAEKGIEHFFYAQVDNPLVRACDPTLIGFHLLANSEMTTQVVAKRFAQEKVGNVVSIDGKTSIIEYSDLPDEVAQRTNPDGSLVFWAGNIAVHVLDRKFLEHSAKQTLPFHRASKAVPFVNDLGEIERPAKPNAIKFERFVFDLLPMAQTAIVVEGDSAEVFAPVKNADGAPTDTPMTARQALVNQHRRWLNAAGISVDPDAKVEINPRWALDAEEVAKKIQAPANIQVDTYFA